jgi:hypothetical protein
MFTIFTTIDEVLEELPTFYDKWVSSAKQINPDLNESKLEFFYNYGFFHKKVENKEDFYREMFKKCSSMMFEERLDFELSKIRVELVMKSDHLIISNRLPKNIIPSIIEDIITEITKVKMLVEYEYNENEEVKASIPDVDSSIVSFEIIRDVINGDYSKSQNFDIDSILDKISDKGMEALSDEEREFLDKKSKDI